jgi:cupin superfamily acireductone dioxygenase involved in methionine salvage
MIKIINIFPNYIAIKKIDLSKFKINNKKFKKTFESKIKTSLNTDNLFLPNDINYFNIQLTEIFSNIFKALNYKTFVFNVTDIWVNLYNKNDFQGTHVHSSDYCFILYYDVEKSFTVFNSPVKDMLEFKNTHIFQRQYEPNCNRGDLLVFPGYMQHWVRPNSKAKTIAGNIKIIDLK